MSKKNRVLFAVVSGLILSLAWIDGFTGIFAFVGFIPLLFVEHFYANRKDKFRSSDVFLYAFLSFAVWNLFTTWWIKNASWAGLILAILITSFLMSLAFWFFHLVKKRLGTSFGSFAFVLFWIVMEHLYLNAEISWPWLTLGYGFSNDIKLIQWYEYTGALGGSLWILLINIILFNGIQRYIYFQNFRAVVLHAASILVLILVPTSYSFYRFNTFTEKVDPYEIVVIQHNIDPYEKFVSMGSMQQTALMLRLADSAATEDTDFFVAPETAINNNIWLHNMMTVPDLQMVRNFIDVHPQAKFIVGITAYQRYLNEATATCRPLGSSGYYYDSFNSAIQIDTTDEMQIYHKSKLVVGVEKMPYPQYLGFLQKLTLRLGGTFRSHGTLNERVNMVSPHDSVAVAPVICYENVFSEFMSEFVTNGAELIFVITNEGWWGDTPGHRQLNRLSQLHAIEARRSVARSANTGISSLINQKGEIIEQLGWWQRGAINGTLNANDKITFYVEHGDYIARISRFFGLLIALYYIVYGIVLKNNRKKVAE